MTVNFFKNKSPNNKVLKELEMSTPTDCSLKGMCSIINPTIIVSGINITSFNYVYIPDFERYYFIKNVTTRTSDIFEVELYVDVLYSFRQEILSSSAIIDRNAELFQKYITDSEMTCLSYERVQTKVFPQQFSNTGKFILIVSGGSA